MTKTYRIRLDEQAKNKATKIFNDLGMDFSTGIKIYLTQVIKANGIPFCLTNDSSLDRSLNEYDQGKYQSFNLVDELFKDLDGESKE